MTSPRRWLVVAACSGLLAAACFEDPVSSLSNGSGNNEEEESGDGDPGDGDGAPGDGDGDGDPGDGDGEPGDGDGGPGDGDGAPGDGDGDPGCGSAETDCFGNCVDLQTDPFNCGECAETCPALTLCGEGECKEQKYVFVTDAKFPGNFGGIEPTQICNTAAETASLPGSYRAWIAYDNLSPADWPKNDGVYVLRQGGTVAYSRDDLFDGNLQNPINRTEYGEQFLSTPACNGAVSHAVWSGTASNGAPVGPNCVEWTSINDESLGRVGDASATDAKWSASDCTPSCASMLPIYCMQQ